MPFLSTPKRPVRLPDVLSAEQVQQLLEALRLARFRVLFTTIYATGLRISEACALEKKMMHDLQLVPKHVRSRLVQTNPCRGEPDRVPGNIGLSGRPARPVNRYGVGGRSLRQ